MPALRSVLFYVVLFASTVWLGLLAIGLALFTGNTDLAHLAGRIWGNVNLWTAGVRVEVRGLERIDPRKSYIYASNHQSWFDIFAILGKLPVQFRWLAKEELFHLPILGQAMRAIGYIPIDRGDRRKAFHSINRAAAQVKDGTSIVIFPEGTRSVDGVLKDFKKGGFMLAIKSRQPMVPISLSGSYRILPKTGDRTIQPGTILMTLGEPIATAGLTTADRDRLIAAVKQGIRSHLTEREGGDRPTARN
ncbi:MAG: hypothetical protein AUK55_09530 [Syntrophobacteraceae bacterium CG2_30_61_12]|nr:MAG: hypothetical protein AUK55_09530 [Syntrophobacteraceae bacterium CG2_30_61_12]